MMTRAIRGRNGRFGALGFSTVVAALSLGFLAGQLFPEDSAHAEQARPLPALPLLSTGTTIVGEAISYPTGTPPKITAAVVTIPPGAETGLHRHGVPTFGYMLEGELTVDYGEKGGKVLKAGDALLEAIEIPHNGRNLGQAPVRILAVFMGAEGRPTSIPVK